VLNVSELLKERSIP